MAVDPHRFSPGLKHAHGGLRMAYGTAVLVFIFTYGSLRVPAECDLIPVAAGTGWFAVVDAAGGCGPRAAWYWMWLFSQWFTGTSLAGRVAWVNDMFGTMIGARGVLSSHCEAGREKKKAVLPLELPCWLPR